MAITRAALNKRLDQLTRRLRRCAVHASRLWCTRELKWVGTDAELSDAIDLYCRLQPYLPKATPTDQLCPVCREPLWCEPCLDATNRPVWVPDGLPGETEKFWALA
jgi:hypothetical protein